MKVWVFYFYIYVAKHTNEHVEMGKERSERYKSNKYNDYKSKVNKAIKTGRFMSTTSMGDYSPLFHNLIEEKYLDLVKKCLESQKDPEKKRKMIVDKYNDGDRDNSSSGKSSIDIANRNIDKWVATEVDKIKFPERILIKDLLEKTLYELWLEKKNKKNE